VLSENPGYGLMRNKRSRDCLAILNSQLLMAEQHLDSLGLSM
jgi:hypothetical protein